MDFVLVVQVLVNLIDNALKYSPTELPVEIQAQQVGQEMQRSCWRSWHRDTGR